MIESLLIANRGEIACRIIRTARRMGIRTVAVYSEADAGALHVRMADEAVAIGPAPARDSYLTGETILAAAKATGARAIHPAYGFLSENAGFAESVIAAGLVWVGPPPTAIRAMGLKDAAKALMQAAGVPVTPGYLGERQEAGFLAARAAETGYPVLIKAVAGGGGKGMRLVERAEDFADALASCQREAEKSFGNPHVLIERYIARPRHIEVQVFGDSHGTMVHLFERDCSLQRRHQKVIEEAPALGMDEATREALCAAAVRAARAVDYVGAGTVEFIADASQGLRADRIWFMEMNTRLQVEHPVTEAITGVDLVEWQLRVASGEPLPLRQEDLAITGHAMEARLYAEDPSRGFLPSTGRLEHLMLPETLGRVDSGVTQGDTITAHYDPMIAKLIHHGPTRDAARSGLAAMAEATQVWPVKSNAGFLARALADRDFAAGELDTGLIARKGAAWLPAEAPSPAALQAVARAALEEPAGRIAGWRLNAPPAPVVADLACGEDRYRVALDASPASSPPIPHGAGWLIGEAGQTFHVTRWRPRLAEGARGSGAVQAPMPGLVVDVAVKAGEQVAKGQKLLVLEAMKMEQALTAPFDGVVAQVLVSTGDQIAADALLVRIDPAKEEQG